MASFFHRIHLLDPALERVGISCAMNSDPQWCLVADFRSGKVRGKPMGKDGYRAVVYPANDQKDVPLLFNYGHPEVPNPIPENGDSKDVGHPVTVTFFAAMPRLPIRNATATLTDEAGHEVGVWLFSPERPALKGFEMNTLCLIPQCR